MDRVEELLSNIDYSFKWYKPSKEALAFVNFIKMVEGGEPENKTPVTHLILLDQIFSPKRRHAVMCHRGFAKSTLISEYLQLYIAIFKKIPRFGRIEAPIIFIGDTVEGGVKTLRDNLEYRYDNSSFLKEWLPKAKFTEKEIEFVNKAGEPTKILLFGSQQNIRGTRAYGKRPMLAILDDIVSDIDAYSEASLRRIENNINRAVLKALHPSKYKVILIGTPFHQNDPVYRRVNNSKWEASVFPICEKFPCSKNEFRGSWEERFPYEYVLDQYENAKEDGDLDGFYQELMLQIKPNEDLLFDLREDFPEIAVGSKKGTFYITTDFATSEKRSSDFSVISVWKYDGNKMILYDGICKRQTMDKNIDDLFYFVQKYKPLYVGLEVASTQKAFVNWIQKEMNQRSIWFNIVEVRPNNSKFQRVLEILPLIKKGIFAINKNLNDEFKKELYNELKNVTKTKIKSKHDDVIDTITQLINLDIINVVSNANFNYECNDYTDIYEEYNPNREIEFFINYDY